MRDGPEGHLAAVIAEAERFDELAEVAELMGDEQGARRLRAAATARRQHAFDVLDG